MARMILLNAAVPKEGTAIVYYAATPEQVMEDLQKYGREAWLNFIGHASTAALVGLPSNRAMYDPRPGDWGYILGLKKRPLNPCDLPDVTWEDIRVLKFVVYDAKELGL